ncbi:MAG: hypothetical protein QHC90_29310, partial [Shinella sp.]|nr:hypothetical protein [Shinella sp.]
VSPTTMSALPNPVQNAKIHSAKVVLDQISSARCLHGQWSHYPRSTKDVTTSTAITLLFGCQIAVTSSNVSMGFHDRLPRQVKQMRRYIFKLTLILVGIAVSLLAFAGSNYHNPALEHEHAYATSSDTSHSTPCIMKTDAICDVEGASSEASDSHYPDHTHETLYPAASLKSVAMPSIDSQHVAAKPSQQPLLRFSIDKPPRDIAVC